MCLVLLSWFAITIQTIQINNQIRRHASTSFKERFYPIFDFCKPNFGSSTGSLLYLKDITKEERKKIRQEEKRRKEGNYELSWRSKIIVGY